mmetsp:Transcript_42597/g.110051  ORF Transcript_42597/g.110051 Transcript_42597/m.110051 type:complete len:134 (+) Transcript_42597:104-505(+)|eukprot:CAMPEP_0195120966 /NCGR_PEP_ID=MMETSP0448-20130528/123142_1 /TAXON_ID=66468 /ORGANISM="Heterocapsa triquestra, Strain CCMP 448" /LENGTH=133 /DNA_ID=CAMNT_0040158423 /DNA_START=53 /DNA_END=454 /DNA_ORIENTATION=-
MGAALSATCCDAGRGETITSPSAGGDGAGHMLAAAQVATSEGMPSLQAKDAQGSLLDTLQGSWVRQMDRMPMGEIRGTQVYWDQTFQSDPSEITVLPDGVLELELQGDKHTGQYKTSPATCLQWSDGEVWVRP